MTPQDQKSSIIRIFLTNFIDMLAFGMVIPVFAFLFDDGPRGLFTDLYPKDELVVFYLILMGAFSMGTFLGAPLIGALSDKWGRKKMLLFVYLANICTYLIFIYGVLYKNLEILYVGRILGGLMGGSLLVVQSAIADVSSEEDKTKNFGITGISFGLGFIIGALLGGILSDPAIVPWFGYHIPFIGSCIVIGFNIIFLTLFFKETNHHRTSKNISIFTGITNVYKAFTNPSLRNIFIIIFLFTIAFNYFIQVFQLFAVDKFGFSESQIGYLFAFIGLSTAFIQGFILRYVSNWFSTEKIMVVAMLFLSLSYLLILVPSGWFMLCAAMFVLLLFQGHTFPPSLAVVSNRADKNIQGETIGINQSVQSLAAAIPAIVFAFTSFFDVKIGNSLVLPMWFGAGSTFVAWLLFVFLIFKKRKN